MTSAAPRDASWYDHPDVHSAKAVHVDNGDEFAVCNTGMLLGSPTWLDASDVPEHIRCRRKACADAYRAATPGENREEQNR